MSRVASEKQYNSFVKGLITEASPLTFPEQAFLDGDNIVLNRTGGFSRRLGIDYEDDFVLIDTSITGGSLLETKKSFHKWNFAGGDPNTSLGVVRVADKLYFLDMLAVSPSTSLKNGGSPLTIAGLSNSRIETTVVNGGLVLVSKDLDKPIYLEYNATTDVVSQETISVKVRDFWGIDDSLSDITRPSILSASHKYNLLNQGWPLEHINTVAYPSNADIWTLGKNASDTFDIDLLNKNSTDNAPAPKGRYILDVFNRGTSRVSEASIADLPLDAEQGRISSVATYAGRVFYTGVSSRVTGGDKKSPSSSGYIFFSKTVSSKDDLGKCYQEADPTSENISDIIATDGGAINIIEATKIIKLVSTRNSLIVIAENGVWEIYGSDFGFKATEYQLSRVTNIGSSNPNSVVVAGDVVIYWTKSGIFALVPDQTTGRMSSQNLSLTTIQTFYDELPVLAKENAKGTYDYRNNTVRWLYNEDVDDEYNRELILDLTLQAFYTNSVSYTSVFIADYVEVPNYVSNTFLTDVYVGTDVVMVDTDVVQISTFVNENRNTSFYFLTINSLGQFTLSKYKNTSFLDWVEAGESVDYSSYIVTGYELFGDIMRKKQATYLILISERTEDGFTVDGVDVTANNQSSCLVSCQWNWTNSAAGGKWGDFFQAYRYIRPYTPTDATDTYDTGDRVIVTKSKIRGSGRALSLHIKSETGKDMRVLGWSIPMTGNSRV